jgi:protoporphyrinogen/coproporphyrinogen III oxidase
MESEITKPIAIVGGGIAGLTAANYLHQKNVPFVLYEAGKKIAGLASSFKDAEGFSYDFGAHFVTNRLAAMLGVSGDCKVVKYYGESVWLNGKVYSYPFGLVKVLRMTLSGIKSQLTKNGDEKTAQNWFRSRYGKALADEVALPIIEAWSGAKAEDLSSSVGESLPGSIAGILYMKLASKVLKRAVCSGYSRELPESPNVYHVYPNEGVHTLCEKLAENLHDKIKLESPVEEILVENDKVVAVRAKGVTQAVSAVISTAPAPILAKITKGTDKLEKFSKFKYRPMTFVNMRFEGRGLLPDVVLWLPENKFPFFRLTEATLSMPWLAPEGKTMITVDIGCEKDDEIWTMDNEKLGLFCLEHLAKIIPNAKEKYLGCHTLRTPISYPVFLKDYEQERLDFEKGTGIENLLSVGRNGEFAHIFMEDVYWRTLQKTRKLVKLLS